jgi:hypothetical protein
MKKEWYVLKRQEDQMIYQIVAVLADSGADPLYGHGSWDIYGGPYTSLEEAEAAMNAAPE